MKKTTYLRPEIKVRRIEAESLMAASGFKTTTTMGFGSDGNEYAPSGATGDAKRNTIINWDEEEE